MSTKAHIMHIHVPTNVMRARLDYLKSNPHKKISAYEFVESRGRKVDFDAESFLVSVCGMSVLVQSHLSRRCGAHNLCAEENGRKPCHIMSAIKQTCCLCQENT